MEEQNKKNNVYLILSIILYVVAAVLISVGISRVVKASNSTFDNFNQFGNISDNFNDMGGFPFETVSTNAGINSSGIANGVMFIVGGGFSIILASIFLFVHFHKNGSFSKMGKNMIDRMMDTIAYTKDAFSSKVLNTEKKEDVYCEYCGCIIKEDETKCQNCGASKKSKN